MDVHWLKRIQTQPLESLCATVLTSPILQFWWYVGVGAQKEQYNYDLICLQNSQPSQRDKAIDAALTAITIIGCVISIICLLVCIITLTVFKYVSIPQENMSL